MIVQNIEDGRWKTQCVRAAVFMHLEEGFHDLLSREGHEQVPRVCSSTASCLTSPLVERGEKAWRSTHIKCDTPDESWQDQGSQCSPKTTKKVLLRERAACHLVPEVSATDSVASKSLLLRDIERRGCMAWLPEASAASSQLDVAARIYRIWRSYAIGFCLASTYHMACKFTGVQLLRDGKWQSKHRAAWYGKTATPRRHETYPHR